MYASNPHSYTHLLLALGIVREPTVWGFITSKYPGIHDIGLPTHRPAGMKIRSIDSEIRGMSLWGAMSKEARKVGQHVNAWAPYAVLWTEHDSRRN